MRKLFFLFLAFVATTSLWAHDFEVDGIYYNYLDGNNVEVTYRGDYHYSYNNEYAGEVIIPETVTYNGTTYSVTSIGDEAFGNCFRLTSITIPNSVTSIGDEAFRGCSSLTTPVYNAHCFAYMPTSFEGAYVIPEGIKQIAGRAFYNCSSLTSITIPNSVTSIGDHAFAYCSSLTSVTIGNSVTSIGDWAFHDCSSLTSVTIGNSVTSIGGQAFEGCSSLTTPVYNAHCFAYMPTSFKGAYVIPEGIKQIAGGAFHDCSSLTSITIPNSVTSIGHFAFAYCSSLTSITIPNSVTSIGGQAFEGCSSLTSITIPNSVTSIGNYAFEDCSSLTTPVYNAHCFAYMPTSFKGAYVIPEGIKQIAGGAFRDCSSLTSITIPNSVTSIGYRAFEGCSSLTSVTIPNSVTSIGEWAFKGCSSLTSIVVESGNSTYDSRENCNAIIETATNTLVVGCKNTIIPNSVTSIGDYAFAYCSSLTSVTIPNSVTSIGTYAFSGCSSLTSITIPNSVTSIEFYAFADCSSLTSITIPNSVTSIGTYAFSSCSSLTSITCLGTTPPDAINLGANTSTCKLIVPHSAYNAYLRHTYWGQFLNIVSGDWVVTLLANNNQWGEVTGDGLYTNDTTITITATPYEGYTFLRWSDGNTDNPRTLTVTKDITLTAEFAQSFSGQCGDNLYWNYDETTKTISITGSGKMYDYTASTQPWILFKEDIKEVTICNKATSIGISAFEGCISLGKLSIGPAMKNIAADAFAGCKRLYDIYCYAYPPFAEETSFTNYNVYLYIPCEYQRDYKLDVVWGKFKFIECIESEDVTTDGNVTIVPGYNDVTITWPTEEGADTYTIVIKKDGKVVCTHTFNSEGQLISIAFAPGRDGNHPAQYAEAVANGGYRFTVTGLEEGTHYTYNIDVKNTANQTINSHTGAFTTQSTTAVDNITTTTANIQKIMRSGQLIILRDGVEYNAMGQEL